MDSTTSQITKDGIQQLINEALKQNPNDPSSNGYGFVVATLFGLCIVLLAVVWFLYRDQKRERKAADAERKQARLDAAKQIDHRFDKLEGSINAGLDEIEAQTKLAITDLQSKHALAWEELTRLKTIIEIQKGGK